MTNYTHQIIDGYSIDLSAGVKTNQILQYNGTKFVAANNKLNTAYYNPLTVYNNALTVYAGSYTQGCRFMITTYATTITGATFVFPENVSRTIRFRLWTDGAPGTALAIGAAGATYYDYAVSVAGTYTVTFPTPYAVTPPTILILSEWESSGTKYYEATPACVAGTFPTENTFVQCGPNFAWIDLYRDHTGDAFPSIGGTGGSSPWCGLIPTWTV